MRYTVEIEIDRPRDEVVARFTDPATLSEWQPGLREYALLSGEPGQPGSTSKHVHQMGKRVIEMTETVVEADLPDHYFVTYEADKVWNGCSARFIELPEGRTRLVYESEFRCKGVMRVVTKVMPGAFRKETEQSLERFKAFAES